MKVIIIDTETSGLDASNNDILQLSYLIVNIDNWKIEKAINHYFPWRSVKRVDVESIHINGLTREFMSTVELSDRKLAMDVLALDIAKCDAIVGHNFRFDEQFILRTARSESVVLPRFPYVYDTMLDTTNLCKIPRMMYDIDDDSEEDYCNSYKYPKLAELADFLGVKFCECDLHNSMADVKLTFECFKKLCKSQFYELGLFEAFNEKPIRSKVLYITDFLYEIDEMHGEFLASMLEDRIIEIRLVTSKNSRVLCAYYKNTPFAVVVNDDFGNVIKSLDDNGKIYAKIGIGRDSSLIPCVFGYNKFEFEYSMLNPPKGINKLIQDYYADVEIDIYKLSRKCTKSSIMEAWNDDKEYMYEEIAQFVSCHKD